MMNADTSVRQMVFRFNFRECRECAVIREKRQTGSVKRLSSQSNKESLRHAVKGTLRPLSAIRIFASARRPAAPNRLINVRFGGCEQMQQVHHYYSITSSARASTVAGRSRPSALATFKLMTSSNLVGCSTGRSAGLAPLKILSTKVAARR